MYLDHHGRENGYNDLGIYPKEMYSIVAAAYKKGFYEQVYSDSSCYGTLQRSLPSMKNAVLDFEKLLKVRLLSADKQEITTTLPLLGKVTLNEDGTSKKRDRDDLLKDQDNSDSLVIKLTIQGTQIHTGNYTEDRRNIYTEDWIKRELNHSKSMAALVDLMKDENAQDSDFEAWFNDQKHTRGGEQSSKYSIEVIGRNSKKIEDITLNQYKQAAKHLIEHYNERRSRKPIDDNAAKQPPFNYTQEDLNTIKENDQKISAYIA